MIPARGARYGGALYALLIGLAVFAPTAEAHHRPHHHTVVHKHKRRHARHKTQAAVTQRPAAPGPQPAAATSAESTVWICVPEEDEGEVCWPKEPEVAFASVESEPGILSPQEEAEETTEENWP